MGWVDGGLARVRKHLIYHVTILRLSQMGTLLLAFPREWRMAFWCSHCSEKCDACPVLGSYIVEMWMLFHHHRWAEKCTNVVLKVSGTEIVVASPGIQRHPGSGSVWLRIRLWKLSALGLLTLFWLSQEAPGHAEHKNGWNYRHSSATSSFSPALCQWLEPGDTWLYPGRSYTQADWVTRLCYCLV